MILRGCNRHAVVFFCGGEVIVALSRGTPPPNQNGAAHSPRDLHFSWQQHSNPQGLVVFAMVYAGALQMVTSPGVSTAAVTSAPEGGASSSEATYTAALKKMEAESLADLEKAFDETAKKAKAESDKIWANLEAEFAEDDAEP